MEGRLRGQSVCQYAFALAPQPHFHAVVTQLPERSITKSYDEGRERMDFCLETSFEVRKRLILKPFGFIRLKSIAKQSRTVGSASVGSEKQKQ